MVRTVYSVTLPHHDCSLLCFFSEVDCPAPLWTCFLPLLFLPFIFTFALWAEYGIYATLCSCCRSQTRTTTPLLLRSKTSLVLRNYSFFGTPQLVSRKPASYDRLVLLDKGFRGATIVAASFVGSVVNVTFEPQMLEISIVITCPTTIKDLFPSPSDLRDFSDLLPVLMFHDCLSGETCRVSWHPLIKKSKLSSHDSVAVNMPIMDILEA